MSKYGKKQTQLQPHEPVQMLTISQVAEILAVSHATVFRLIKYEGLPITKMGHTTRIPQHMLHTWIEEHTA